MADLDVTRLYRLKAYNTEGDTRPGMAEVLVGVRFNLAEIKTCTVLEQADVDDCPKLLVEAKKQGKKIIREMLHKMADSITDDDQDQGEGIRGVLIPYVGD